MRLAIDGRSLAWRDHAPRGGTGNDRRKCDCCWKCRGGHTRTGQHRRIPLVSSRRMPSTGEWGNFAAPRRWWVHSDGGTEQGRGRRKAKRWRSKQL